MTPEADREVGRAGVLAERPSSVATLLALLRSRGVVVFASAFVGLWAFLIVVLVQVPWIAAGGPKPFGAADKAVHCGLYAFATFWAALAVSARVRLGVRDRFVLWLGVCCFGACEEIAQGFVDRSTSLRDLTADATGAALGLMLSALLAETVFCQAAARRAVVESESRHQSRVDAACRRLAPRTDA
ncbi:MAG: VanZ family protein [Planctomycetota bacterium]